MSEKLAQHEESLGEAMGPVIEYAAFELNRDAADGAVLAPLGSYPRAAEAIAMSLVQEDDPYIRCIGALIPGYAEGCDPEVLEEIWRLETERRKCMEDDQIDDDAGLEAALTVAETNSVAERVLISSVRWLRLGGGKQQTAMRILRDMVERTLEGENWNDAHWALSALCRYQHPDSAELVTRFAAIQSGPEYFPLWAQRLRDGDPEALSVADDLVNSADAAQRGTTLPRQQRKELDALLAAARAYEAAQA